MLRSPPSRIDLTSSDILAFERRKAGRRSALLRQRSTSNVRLSPGPAHSTSHSIVPAEQNIGRRRCASSSSEATVHETDQTSSENTSAVNWPKQDDQVASLTADKPCSRPSPRRQVDSYYGTAVTEPTGGLPSITGSSLVCLDGFTESGVPHAPVQVACNFATLSTPATHTALGTPRRHVGHVATARPQLLCSARARRRHRHAEYESALADSWLGDVDNTANTALNDRQMVPHIVLPLNDAELPVNPSLDPGAPVFVPRTRFGTASSSSGDGGGTPRWSSVDTTHSAIDLRIRSPWERDRNVLFGSRQTGQGPFDIASATSHIRSDLEHASRNRRQRSRTTDQNANFPGTANVERYPLFRVDPPSGAAHQYNRLSQRMNTNDHARIVSPVVPYHHDATRLQVTSSEYDHFYGQNALSSQGRNSQSVTPVMLRDTRSTPDLMEHSISPARIYSRGSSLSLTRPGPGAIHKKRLASGITHAGSTSGHVAAASREGLDATTEFLRMRSSPLDDLTERLGRLSASRAVSLDRSSERLGLGQRRISLLAGDPFRADPCTNRKVAGGSASSQPHILLPPRHGLQQTKSAEDCSLEDLVALSLALPPSSSFPSSPQANEITPTAENADIASTNPCKGTQDITTAFSSSPPSTIKRKPVPSCKTPKVKVYDDSKPPSTQPQTREDVGRSARRSKARSDITSSSPLGSRKAKHNLPITIPERHVHRHTYPSTSHSQDNFGSGTANVSIMAHVQGTMQAARTIPNVSPSRGESELENELRGHLIELEDDRRIWIERQEDGPLDVTPPKEGRYERYLS